MKLILGSALIALVVAGCAPAQPTVDPTAPSPSVASTSVGYHDWSYLDPPSASRFTAYLEVRYPELHRAGAQLLWAGDSAGAAVPSTMSLPGKGRLLVELACTDGGKHELGVAAMNGTKRVFWVMTNSCHDPTSSYSGEKPFDAGMDTSLVFTSSGVAKYVVAAYFIPDPIS